MRRSPRQRAGALLALGALLAATAACGARWSDEERAAVHARGAGGREAAGDGDGGGSLVVDLGGGAAGGGAGGAPTTGGGTAGVGGSAAPTEGSAGGPGGPAPCEAPSSAPGVTADEIRVAEVSSLSGPSPGLGESSAAAARAYVAHLNASGGVCGRRVVLREADDGTETSRYRAIVQDLGSKVLGIAGGFALGDVGGLDLIRQLQLPVVNVPSDDRGTAEPTMFDVNPPYADPDAAVGKYRYLHDQGVRKATQVYLAVAQSRTEAQRQARLMRAAGIEVVDVNELPLSTLSYDGHARRALNSGADYLFFIGDPAGNGAMARAMHGTGRSLRFEEYYTFAYGGTFLDQAGPAAAEGAITWIWWLPNEEAGRNPELARFVEWMDRTAPGTVKDQFAADSWGAAKAFFDALAALPGPITREALVARLRAVGTYDADGMRMPIELGAETQAGCVVGMQVRDGAWTRMTPARGFLC